MGYILNKELILDYIGFFKKHKLMFYQSYIFRTDLQTYFHSYNYKKKLLSYLSALFIIFI